MCPVIIWVPLSFCRRFVLYWLTYNWTMDRKSGEGDKYLARGKPWCKICSRYREEHRWLWVYFDEKCDEYFQEDGVATQVSNVGGECRNAECILYNLDAIEVVKRQMVLAKEERSISFDQCLVTGITCTHPIQWLDHTFKACMKIIKEMWWDKQLVRCFRMKYHNGAEAFCVHCASFQQLNSEDFGNPSAFFVSRTYCLVRLLLWIPTLIDWKQTHCCWVSSSK